MVGADVGFTGETGVAVDVGGEAGDVGAVAGDLGGQVEIASGGVFKPRGQGVGGVAGEGGGAAVAGDDQFIGKIIADQGTRGVGVAVLDGVGVGAGLIHGVVVNRRAGGRFEANGRPWVAGGTRVGDKIILDKLYSGMALCLKSTKVFT